VREKYKKKQYDLTGRFELYTDSLFNPVPKPYYYGLDHDTILDYSNMDNASGEDLYLLQDEMRNNAINFSCPKDVFDQLEIVDRIYMRKEYFREDIWFSYAAKNAMGMKTIVLIKEFEYNEELGTLTFNGKTGTGVVTIKIHDVKKMYNPRSRKVDSFMEDTSKVILEAKTIIEKHSKEMSNRSRLNDKRFVQVMDNYINTYPGINQVRQTVAKDS